MAQMSLSWTQNPSRLHQHLVNQRDRQLSSDHADLLVSSVSWEKEEERFYDPVVDKSHFGAKWRLFIVELERRGRGKEEERSEIQMYYLWSIFGGKTFVPTFAATWQQQFHFY